MHERLSRIDNEPTQEEIRQAAEVLNRLPRGFLPLELFIAVAEKVATPTMELAPLRRNANGSVEVLLVQRPEDDLHWPGAWHMPGTILRATDEEGSFKSGFERILDGELHGAVKPINDIQLVGTKFWDIERGRELDHIHYFETDVRNEDLIDGRFFDVNSLPELIIPHHKKMIPEIVEAFISDKK